MSYFSIVRRVGSLSYMVRKIHGLQKLGYIATVRAVQRMLEQETSKHLDPVDSLESSHG